MNIHEYQAKKIFSTHGINVPQGSVILDANEIDKIITHLNFNKYILKAQVHSGGRGKAGGIKVCGSREIALEEARRMLGTTLYTAQAGKNGKVVKKLYIEDGCSTTREYYISLVVNRSKNCLTFIGSSSGGMDIEEVAKKTPDKVTKIDINLCTAVSSFHCRKMAYALGMIDNEAKQLHSIMSAMYKIFVKYNCNQIEINPLASTTDGELLALDAKITFDDNALYKHPNINQLRDTDEEDPLELRAIASDLSYIKLDGNIGCMVNGAGLAMATMDIIKMYGGEPANFLDVGGSADKTRIITALEIILSDQNVKGILVNIFGGIMRCDIIAEGIVSAARTIDINVPLVVRLAGTNADIGIKILNESGLKIIAAIDLSDASNKIINAVKTSN